MVYNLEKARALYEEGLVDAFHEGLEKGEAIGLAKAEARGETIGKTRKAIEIAEKLFNIDMEIEQIM